MRPSPSLTVLSLRGPPDRDRSGLEPTVASLSGELDLATLGDLCETLAAVIAFRRRRSDPGPCLRSTSSTRRQQGCSFEPKCSWLLARGLSCCDLRRRVRCPF